MRREQKVKIIKITAKHENNVLKNKMEIDNIRLHSSKASKQKIFFD